MDVLVSLPLDSSNLGQFIVPQMCIMYKYLEAFIHVVHFDTSVQIPFLMLLVCVIYYYFVLCTIFKFLILKNQLDGKFFEVMCSPCNSLNHKHSAVLIFMII